MNEQLVGSAHPTRALSRTFYMPIATINNPSQPAGTFAAQSDVEDQFGRANVAAWSQLDNSQSTDGTAVADEDRILRALQWADAKINHIFCVQGNYAAPLVPQGDDALLLCRWAAVLAGAWLYLSRGLRDGDAVGNHLQRLEDEAIAEMTVCRASQHLQAARRWPTATSPVGYLPRE